MPSKASGYLDLPLLQGLCRGHVTQSHGSVRPPPMSLKFILEEQMCLLPQPHPPPACLLHQEEGGTLSCLDLEPRLGPMCQWAESLETPLHFPFLWKGQASCMERPRPCFLSPLTKPRRHRLLAFSRGSSTSTASWCEASFRVRLGWAMSLSDLVPGSCTPAPPEPTSLTTR